MSHRVALAVAAITQLGATLGLATIAEAIETQDEMDALAPRSALAARARCKRRKVRVADKRQLLNMFQASDAPKREIAAAGHGDPRGERVRRVADREKLARSRRLAEARGQVRRPTEVVVAVEEQHLPVGDTPA